MKPSGIRLGSRGRLAIAIFTAGAILAATVASVGAVTPSASGGASAVTAQAAPVVAQRGDAKEEAKLLCETYQASLASGLGVTTDQLRAAQLAATNATIYKALADKVITAQTAKKLKDQLAKLDGPVCDVIAQIRAGAKKRTPVIDPQALLQVAATTLTTDVATLKAEIRALKAGEDLRTLAAKHHVSYDTLKAALHAEADRQLDAAVGAGRITQAQADKLLVAFDRGLEKGHFLPRPPRRR
jgi:hypothetical protein